MNNLTEAQRRVRLRRTGLDARQRYRDAGVCVTRPKPYGTPTLPGTGGGGGQAALASLPEGREGREQLSETPKLHIYEVGIMSNVAYVKAPNAMAAALWYGFNHTEGNAQCMVAVYEEDGRKYEGPSPWLAWAFGKEPSEDELAQIKRDIPHCRLVRKPKGGRE